MKYFWQKRYIIPRWDLEQEDMRLVAWITQNKVDNIGFSEPDSLLVTVDSDGYYTGFKNINQPDAKYVWRMWWAERDEKGFWKSESFSDNVNYSTMEEVKIATQKKFLPEDAVIKTIDCPVDFTEY